MLRAIKNAVLTIVSFFTSVFIFIGNFIRELFTLAKLLFKSSSAIPSYLNFYPAVFTSVVISLVAIAVLYKLLGREG